MQNSKKMEISFLGGVGTVTGSKFLVSNHAEQILVDCGLYQGVKQLRLLNWDKFPVDVQKISAVLLTHAHLDHCGYLPLLVKRGFKGPIYCTPPTAELTQIILLDAAKIQMEDAAYANKKGFSKHHPAEPLYDLDDAKRVLPLLQPVPFNETKTMSSFSFQFKSSGHILGASSVYIWDKEAKFLFSGDLGRYDDPLMFPPEAPEKCDYIIMESTYGDRIHSKVSTQDLLQKLILRAWHNKGVLLIPAFAVGRSQNLIFEIIELKRKGRIPIEMPIYFNSPMGVEVSELYKKYHDFQKLHDGEFDTYLAQIHFVRTSEESKTLNEKRGPMVIIAASGMLTGGRVLHHLKAFGPHPQNIILLAGFQTLGTRGWSLANNQTAIKVHGSYVNIAAQVETSDAFSAHADQTELLQWLASAPQKPQRIFLVHGEPIAADELRKKIEEELKIPVTIPSLGSNTKYF
ncbi:MBL fold metallo-hydrolase RNA specificity domain-containing protein [Bdellovibrio sp. HCB-162]|uniref:MBL fold metallo-hydrolase RNA specificity domain-containing protein n=1 Tax=Bdellovibrio sp. HCB-162 TaxID=3394234 RepID=UPI0039BD8551